MATSNELLNPILDANPPANFREDCWKYYHQRDVGWTMFQEPRQARSTLRSTDGTDMTGPRQSMMYDERRIEATKDKSVVEETRRRREGHNLRYRGMENAIRRVKWATIRFTLTRKRNQIAGPRKEGLEVVV